MKILRTFCILLLLGGGKMNYGEFLCFNKPSEFAEKFLLVSDGMGYMSDRTFSLKRGRFDNFVVISVLSGIFHIEQGGAHIEVRGGESILLDLRVPHKYYNDPKCGGEFLWMHFRGEAVKGILSEIELPHSFPGCLEDDFEEIYKAAVSRAHDYEVEVSALLYSMILRTVKEKLSAGISADSNPFYTVMNRFVENNLYKTITLQEMADEMHMSKYHFSRLFKQNFNLTPLRFVLEKRLGVAKQMLISSDAKIGEISGLLCFSDQSHFSKAFFEKFGITPSAYRRNHR